MYLNNMFMKTVVITVYGLLLLLSNHLIEAHPNGAPPESCATMIPNHGVPAQTSPSPYMTTFPQDNNLLVSGNKLPLTLHSISNNNSTFRGFLVVALDVNNPIVSVGTFYSISNDSKPFQCTNNSLNSAITHVTNNDKTSVVVNWMPPDGFVGEVIFRTTYVMNVSTFWVHTISSQIVTVVAAPTTTSLTASITSTMITNKPNNSAIPSISTIPANLTTIMSTTPSASTSRYTKSPMTIIICIFFIGCRMMRYVS